MCGSGVCVVCVCVGGSGVCVQLHVLSIDLPLKVCTVRIAGIFLRYKISC